MSLNVKRHNCRDKVRFPVFLWIWGWKIMLKFHCEMFQKLQPINVTYTVKLCKSYHGFCWISSKKRFFYMRILFDSCLMTFKFSGQKVCNLSLWCYACILALFDQIMINNLTERLVTNFVKLRHLFTSDVFFCFIY